VTIVTPSSQHRLSRKDRPASLADTYRALRACVKRVYWFGLASSSVVGRQLSVEIGMVQMFCTVMHNRGIPGPHRMYMEIIE
jgi:hypothetical protein